MPGYEWLKEMFSDPKRMQAVENLAKVADDLGVTLAQMSLAWILKNPNVSTVITGASKLSQIEENFKALDVVPMLSDDVMTRIEEALADYPDDTEVN